ncbi:hypothetical protein PLEOSDRAFT_1089032 [Pleurotus ostreatus PC15]|uniref:Asl1-like glycosyl hydrolase catalytic domain-containing protein n=1 Tax=Pleurotus ostreatus (strain PC15) TaxID=1137138 RepID=A0A067NM66_PLEO1|nr:hypothetical protein PLEOSDRAFT_1089032 [Pleurotus ostreatus PC15]
MASKILNLLAMSTLAILASSFGPASVTALSVDSHHLVRQVPHAHGAVAKRKRSVNRRCKPRPTTKTPSVPTPAPATGDNGSSGNNGGSGGSGTTKPADPKPQSDKGAASSTPAAPKPSVTPKPADNNNNNGGSNNSGSGSGKVGLAWPNGEDIDLANWHTGSTKFIYTWSPWIPAKAKSLGFAPAPMLWGEKQLSDFKKLVKPGYANIAMGFNEPDQGGQANMSPSRGCSLWWENLNPLKDQGYQLISPACTNAPSGTQWMKDFMGCCRDCRIDAVATHFYGTSAQALIQHVTDIHNLFGKDVWVTEFACQNFGGSGGQCSKAQVNEFMDTVTGFFDNTPWVKAYFAFGAMHDMFNVNPDNQLMGADGKPNALGRKYIKA